MIYLNGHGHGAVPSDAQRAYRASCVMPLWAACGFGAAEYYPETPTLGPFRYFFPDAPSVPHCNSTTEALDALGAAMIEQTPPPSGASLIPPVMTYLGQFIDHDITANTDREAGLSMIDAIDVVPARRDSVLTGLGNLREGALNLDSVYGGAVLQGQFAEHMRAALRFPRDRSKLWIGTDVDVGFDAIPLPEDPARDLLRLDRLLSGNGSPVSEEDIRALPDPLRGLFVNADGSLRRQRAIIADPRNDENLVVAQLHLAFLRQHNRIVDVAHHHGGPVGDADALFDWARGALTDIYQWLVLHAYLPSICDPDVLAQVIAERAPLYRRLFAEKGDWGRPGVLPMPLEFSVAAFRFGHSMVRGSYDWSRAFGEPAAGSQNLLDRASFQQLFAFTGGAREPMPVPGSGSAPRLPSHWPVEWARLAGPIDPAFPDRAARPIDTFLAVPLAAMENEEPGAITGAVMQHLAQRNLRRGHRLSIPTAQSCLAAFAEQTGTAMASLTRQELLHGTTGRALEAGAFDRDTPLWFYVLKEAEVLGRLGRLGPLGSRLVAETLVGLLVHDPTSIWHQKGSGEDGRWHPRDGARPGGIVVDSMPAFFRAAGVM